MELVIEFIIELLFEGGMEISSNRKISKWIRYPLIALLALIFGTVIFLIIFLGIGLLDENIIAGLIFTVIGLGMLIGGIVKFRKVYMKKKIKEE